AHRLEPTTPRRDRLELLVDRLLEALEPGREQLEPALGHRADAQCLDDLAALERPGRDRSGRGHLASSTPNCCARFPGSRCACRAWRSKRSTGWPATLRASCSRATMPPTRAAISPSSAANAGAVAAPLRTRKNSTACSACLRSFGSFARATNS